MTKNFLYSRNVLNLSLTMIDTQMQTRYPVDTLRVNCDRWPCYMRQWCAPANMKKTEFPPRRPTSSSKPSDKNARAWGWGSWLATQQAVNALPYDQKTDAADTQLGECSYRQEHHTAGTMLGNPHMLCDVIYDDIYQLQLGLHPFEMINKLVQK